LDSMSAGMFSLPSTIALNSKPPSERPVIR
jgi:hypothetical protein